MRENSAAAAAAREDGPRTGGKKLNRQPTGGSRQEGVQLVASGVGREPRGQRGKGKRVKAAEGGSRRHGETLAEARRGRRGFPLALKSRLGWRRKDVREGG